MKNILFVLLVITMAGCADVPLISTQVDAPADHEEVRPDTSLDAIYKLDAWALKGRIAIQMQKEGITATLHWAQVGERYQLRFIAPLSQGTYVLRGDQEQVALQTANNQFFTAKDPEQLLFDNVGWKVPLNGLKYWVRGLPDPSVDLDSSVRDIEGRITDMEQSGWRISILRYTDVEEFKLPGKLLLQNDRFKLRLVIQGWQTIL